MFPQHPPAAPQPTCTHLSSTTRTDTQNTFKPTHMRTHTHISMNFTNTPLRSTPSKDTQQGHTHPRSHTVTHTAIQSTQASPRTLMYSHAHSSPNTHKQANSGPITRTHQHTHRDCHLATHSRAHTTFRDLLGGTQRSGRRAPKTPPRGS